MKLSPEKVIAKGVDGKPSIQEHPTDLTRTYEDYEVFIRKSDEGYSWVVYNGFVQLNPISKSGHDYSKYVSQKSNGYLDSAEEANDNAQSWLRFVCDYVLPKECKRTDEQREQLRVNRVAAGLL